MSWTPAAGQVQLLFLAPHALELAPQVGKLGRHGGLAVHDLLELLDLQLKPLSGGRDVGDPAADLGEHLKLPLIGVVQVRAGVLVRRLYRDHQRRPHARAPVAQGHEGRVDQIGGAGVGGPQFREPPLDLGYDPDPVTHRCLSGPAQARLGDKLANRLAAAGVERDLLPGVQPRLRTAQVAHQVDDPVQLVGLEGEDPLVVVKREARHRVGPDVRVFARHHAVLGQQPATLGRVEEVPLVGAHERIHADVTARFLLGEEGRDMALVELGRAVQRHHRPDGLAAAAEPGAAEAHVQFLKIISGGRHPPEHEVRVGPQPLDVIAAPGGDALAGRLV